MTIGTFILTATNYVRARVMSSETDDLSARLVECLKELDGLRNGLSQWIESLEELSEMEDAFEVKEGKKLHGKTILDIGTGCVKPLYIALKFEPDKIIGISQDLSDYPFASDLEQKSRLLTKTEIKLYDCNLFDDENFKKILKHERMQKRKFDFVVTSKTLHHLRYGKCIVADKRNKKHKCPPDEGSCIYKFEEKEIFERLLQLGKRAIVYEWFFPHEEDDDKVRGRGGHFTTEEWRRIFSHLSEHYRVNFVKPLRCQLDKEELDIVIAKLRQVDCICFYVETG